MSDSRAGATPSSVGGGDSAQQGARATSAQVWIAGALTFALVLPFLDKAVHQDDWAYLRVSRLLLEHGSDVFDQTTLYQGIPISAGQGVLHGPVWLVLLGIAQLFGAAALTVAHLFAAGLFGLLGASLAAIAGRIGAPPVRTALTFTAAPAPWVLATSLMTDLPMLALFSAAVALGIRGLQDDDRRALLAAGVFGAGAALTRYHGFAIVPLLGVLPLFLWRFRLRFFLPALVAAVLFFGFLTTTLVLSGQWDMLRATEELSKAVIERDKCLMSTVAALGGVGIGWWVAALSSPGPSLSGLRARPDLCAGLLVGALFGAWLAPQAAEATPAPLLGSTAALHWTFFIAGGATLGGLLLLGLAWLKRLVLGERTGLGREGLLAWLALWSLGFAFAAWVTVPFGSTRYVLPALPGVFLLAAVAAQRGLPAYASWVALVVSGALGLGATVADRNAAAVYPAFADQVAERVAEGGEWSETKTWIWGELGYRWYLEERAGLDVLPTGSNDPERGDRILKSMILSTASGGDGSTGRYRLHPEVVQRMQPGAIQEFADDWPIRVHNSYASAGFYGHEAGFLPWSFSSATHDKLQVWQIDDTNPFFERFEAARREASRLDAEGPDRPALQGSVELKRFRVFAPEEAEGRPAPGGPIDDRMAVEVLLPGRVTWSGVAIGPDTDFVVWVGEHHSLADYGFPGPASIARVRVDGEVVAELRLDTRRGDPKVWRPMVADLGPFAGSSVELTLEVQADPAGPDADARPLLRVGFADPRLRRR